MARRDSSSQDDITGQRVEWYSVEEATVDRSAVGSLESRNADVDRSLINHVRTENAEFSQSAIGMASIDRGTLTQSSAGIVVGRSVACDEVRTFVLVSPVVRGEVHTWFDMRSALAVGVGIALGRALLAGAGKIIRPARR